MHQAQRHFYDFLLPVFAAYLASQMHQIDDLRSSHLVNVSDVCLQAKQRSNYHGSEPDSVVSAAVAISNAAYSVQPQHICRTASIPTEDAGSAAKLVSLLSQQYAVDARTHQGVKAILQTSYQRRPRSPQAFVMGCLRVTAKVQGTSMPINIPMMGRANTFPSTEAGDLLDVDFVPPHIIEQQKVLPPSFLRSLIVLHIRIYENSFIQAPARLGSCSLPSLTGQMSAAGS